LLSPLEFGTATRLYAGMEVNGDAFVIKQGATGALVGVIDGLGHGQYAHEAAEAARQYVEAHFDQSLALIFRGVGRACRATRGVVMALACFAWDGQTGGNLQLTFGSIGNVEVRACGGSERFTFGIRRGILGLNAPEPLITQHVWPPGAVMVLHSDGLRTHWKWEDFPQLARQPATVAAQHLLQALAKDNDDATVVVAKSRLP
jgi:serine/threonine protein phosphatase PrpC